MSDSQAYEEVTISSDGVTVVKRFEADEFPVPAIAFEFSSDRDETVAVRLQDTVPESVAVEDLGFHPEYGSEYWTIDENVISFEREIEAEAGYTTVYGIRATGTDDVQKFLTRPEITTVDPPLPDDTAQENGSEEVIPESDDDVVRDVISGESDDVPGLEDESDEEIETLDLKDPNDGSTSKSASTSESTSSSDDDGAADGAPESAAEDTSADYGDGSETASTPQSEAISVDGDSLVAVLATELRQNDVSADDVKLLRQAFEIAGQEGGSIAARVDRVQADIANLRAYTDALEEFLDENGTAQELIEDFDSDISSLESAVSSLGSTVESNDEQVTAISDEVSSLGDDVAEVSGELSDVTEDVDDVESTVSELESSISSVEDDVDGLKDQIPDGEVADRVADLESDIEDLRNWQDQIKETFGG